jgi:hypothetical protein
MFEVILVLRERIEYNILRFPGFSLCSNRSVRAGTFPSFSARDPRLFWRLLHLNDGMSAVTGLRGRRAAAMCSPDFGGRYGCVLEGTGIPTTDILKQKSS